MSIATLLKQPQLLKQYKHIYLLSHMRANTSLFGHILGDHSEINGYYEMHIGYYSWKSLIRQKLLFAEQHCIKPNSNYFFDKVLHTEHYVHPPILNQDNVISIFSLRPPETTVPSIVKLFENKPNHECHSKEGAIAYYLERVKALATMSQRVKNYIYVDADEIRKNTHECLNTLTQYLNLNSPLTSEFKPQKLTGVGNTGDLSGNLLAGKVKATTSNYDDFAFSDDELTELKDAYAQAREVLLTNSKHIIASQTE